MDGIALVEWTLEVAKIPPERIVILGQSLGTAVATAVVEHFVLKQQTEFAGIVLVAGFSDIPTLMLTYSIGGIIPILSPMRPYPLLQRFFASHIEDTWQTSTRLANFVRNSNNCEVTLIHARNDYEIPWKHSDALFYAAANATSEQGLTFKQIDGVKTHRSLGDSGWTNTWTAAGQGERAIKRIRQEIVATGGKLLDYLLTVSIQLTYGIGHNRIVTYSSVAQAVLKSFKLQI